MAKPNYRHQKKQREEQSRKKQEEKLQRKAARKEPLAPEGNGNPSDSATSPSASPTAE